MVSDPTVKLVKKKKTKIPVWSYFGLKANESGIVCDADFDRPICRQCYKPRRLDQNSERLDEHERLDQDSERLDEDEKLDQDSERLDEDERLDQDSERLDEDERLDHDSERLDEEECLSWEEFDNCGNGPQQFENEYLCQEHLEHQLEMQELRGQVRRLTHLCTFPLCGQKLSFKRPDGHFVQIFNTRRLHWTFTSHVVELAITNKS